MKLNTVLQTRKDSSSSYAAHCCMLETLAITAFKNAGHAYMVVDRLSLSLVNMRVSSSPKKNLK